MTLFARSTKLPSAKPISSRLSRVVCKPACRATSSRYLRVCAAADIAKLGETYWRRSHQLPGALFCNLHNELLSDSSALTSPSTVACQDATEHVDLSNSVPCIKLASREHKLAQEISARCEDVLFGRPSKHWLGCNLNALYRVAAIEIGYKNGLKSLDFERVSRDLVEYYGQDLMTTMGCHIAPTSKALRRAFSTTEPVYHPLINLLVQIFLEHKWRDERTSKDSHFRPKLRAHSWRCPNPHFKHADDFRVPLVEHRHYKIEVFGRYRARCSCGFSFSFTEARDPDRLMPLVIRVTSYGEAFEEHIRQLHKSGRSISSIAEWLNVSLHLAKKLVGKGKLRYATPQMEKIAVWRQQWEEQRSRAAYQKLRQYDRAWLFRQKKRKTGSRKDWSKLDAAYLPLLVAAAKAIREREKPLRVTRTAIGYEANIAAITNENLSKLPRCKAALGRLVESQAEWTKRKRELQARQH